MTMRESERFGDIFILPDGSVQLMTDGALTFEQGVAVTRAIEAAIGSVLPGFRLDGEIESHKDGGPSHVHVVDHTHQHGGH